MIQVPVLDVLNAIYGCLFSFWQILGQIQIGTNEGGITLLEFFIGVVCLDVILFLIFGFLGWGGDDD